MNWEDKKTVLGLVIIMAFFYFFVATAIAGVVIEDYNPKLNGVKGEITNIEGNKLTLKTQKGNLITIKVTGQSLEDKHRLRYFKIGDKVKIQNGELINFNALMMKIEN